MTKNLDFASLSLQDALDLAILIEEEAAERYQELVDQMESHHTAEAAGFYRMMVKNETKHGQELMERRDHLFGEAPRNVERSMLWEVEAPSYDRVHVFMSAREALNVALEAEVKAYEFFVGAIEHVSDASVKTLFEELRGEEIEHQELVKCEIAKLPPESTADMADYVDEPVAQ
jgi:Rubrerythrin.